MKGTTYKPTPSWSKWNKKSNFFKKSGNQWKIPAFFSYFYKNNKQLWNEWSFFNIIILRIRDIRTTSQFSLLPQTRKTGRIRRTLQCACSGQIRYVDRTRYGLGGLVQLLFRRQRPWNPLRRIWCNKQVRIPCQAKREMGISLSRRSRTHSHSLWHDMDLQDKQTIHCAAKRQVRHVWVPLFLGVISLRVWLDPVQSNDWLWDTILFRQWFHIYMERKGWHLAWRTYGISKISSDIKPLTPSIKSVLNWRGVSVYYSSY